MDKEHFLIELNIYLRQLSLVNQQAVLEQYEQIFSEKAAEGLTEYEITKELDSPKIIAEAILKKFDLKLKNYENPYSDWIEISPNDAEVTDDFSYSHTSVPIRQEKETFALRFVQVTGIIALNLFFMIWILISYFSILLAGWITSFAFIVSPILGVFCFFNYGGVYGQFQLSISFLFLGLGLIGLLLMIPISKISFKLLKKYSTWSIAVLRGESIL